MIIDLAEWSIYANVSFSSVYDFILPCLSNIVIIKDGLVHYKYYVLVIYSGKKSILTKYYTKTNFVS